MVGIFVVVLMYFNCFYNLEIYGVVWVKVGYWVLEDYCYFGIYQVVVFFF